MSKKTYGDYCNNITIPKKLQDYSTFIDTSQLTNVCNNCAVNTFHKDLNQINKYHPNNKIDACVSENIPLISVNTYCGLSVGNKHCTDYYADQINLIYQKK